MLPGGFDENVLRNRNWAELISSLNINVHLNLGHHDDHHGHGESKVSPEEMELCAT